MNKLILAALVAVSSLVAKEPKVLPEIKVIIPVTELTVEQVQELCTGDHSDVAFLCEEGTELSLKVLSKCGIFSIKFAPNLTIKIDKTCYLRSVKGKPYISYDLVTWNKNFLNFDNPDVKVGVSADKSHIVIESTFVQVEPDSDE